MTGLLDRIHAGMGPLLNSNPEVEDIDGGITRLREHADGPGLSREGYHHEYIATIDDGYDLHLPPDTGKELLDAYRQDVDLSVVGEQRSEDGRVTVEGDIYVGEEPAWTIINTWEEDAGFGYHGKRIYAEPL